jgi:DNA polymerase-3 subunit epsilon
MREIVLDTETTGLNCLGGDRIIEIGCIELMNHLPTGRTYHQYVNPEHEVAEGALRVHGLTNEFLSKFPVFADVADSFLDFIGDAPLIIHNADFDMGFLNAELARLQRIALESARAVDTVRMARTKFPGAQASLDALCRRFQVDNSDRQLHGALKDADLLAQVYLELIGGRQPGLQLAGTGRRIVVSSQRQIRPPRSHEASADELEAHAAFIAKLKNAIWAS